MAATKLIAMHQNKGRSVMQCLKDRTDYAMNGDKTEEGKYISSYQCNPELVDLEFAQAKKEYLHKTWRQPKGDVRAYQIRQCFKPGEITPEEANETGSIYHEDIEELKNNQKEILQEMRKVLDRLVAIM